jgi:GAF domain-containing protein
MNEPSRGELGAFLGHLATLLSLADLEQQLAPRRAPLPIGDLLRLAQVGAQAEELALFRVRGLDSEEDEALSVVRLGRLVGDHFDNTLVDLPQLAHPLVLSCLLTGASEALGPVPAMKEGAPEEEPASPQFLALVPISHEGSPLGVLRAARSNHPFSDTELSLLEAAARTALSAVFLTQREDTVAELLVALLPPLDPAAAGAPRLRQRVRTFFEKRRALPEARGALVVAASIAELAAHSSRSLALAEDVLEAIHRSLGPSGSARSGERS